jgi:hypothetical protein
MALLETFAPTETQASIDAEMEAAAAASVAMDDTARELSHEAAARLTRAMVHMGVVIERLGRVQTADDYAEIRVHWRRHRQASPLYHWLDDEVLAEIDLAIERVEFGP